MKLTKEKIQTETHYAHMHYEHLKKNLEQYEKDAKQTYRQSHFLCKTCFYLKSGFAGQAFTRFECKNCEKEVHHPNTDTPKYCNECAANHSCCIRCASEL